MTPDQFISSLQAIMGDNYLVSIHPRRRACPQFDVAPEPATFDSDGDPYRVTFSLRPAVLKAIDISDPVIAEYAEASAANIAVQIMRGEAAPAWNG